ncbi:hypothetical protein SDC9_152989 [bioreactor metagenome]|uniref:Uncharacterized protein n=1 Tax=bioreactor metagenome TaxID=1076179 RepID=A0A645EWD1_9ZZZZ
MPGCSDSAASIAFFAAFVGFSSNVSGVVTVSFAKAFACTLLMKNSAPVVYSASLFFLLTDTPAFFRILAAASSAFSAAGFN